MSLMQAMIAVFISCTAIFASGTLFQEAHIHQQRAYLREIALMELSSKVACLKANLSAIKSGQGEISLDRFNQAQKHCKDLYLEALSVDEAINAVSSGVSQRARVLSFEITGVKTQGKAEEKKEEKEAGEVDVDKKGVGTFIPTIEVSWKVLEKKSAIVSPISVALPL